MKEPTTKSKSQRDKILAWLRMRGATGVLNTELNELCMRFGARIYELRKAGYDIKTVREGETTFRFLLTEAPKPPVSQSSWSKGAVSAAGMGIGESQNYPDWTTREFERNPEEEKRIIKKTIEEVFETRERPAHEYRKQASLFA